MKKNLILFVLVCALLTAASSAAAAPIMASTDSLTVFVGSDLASEYGVGIALPIDSISIALGYYRTTSDAGGYNLSFTIPNGRLLIHSDGQLYGGLFVEYLGLYLPLDVVEGLTAYVGGGAKAEIGGAVDLDLYIEVEFRMRLDQGFAFYAGSIYNATSGDTRVEGGLTCVF